MVQIFHGAVDLCSLPGPQHGLEVGLQEGLVLLDLLQHVPGLTEPWEEGRIELPGGQVRDGLVGTGQLFVYWQLKL